ncbi:DUF3040 domain-containing protein [Rhodococcus antarcticus]|uniref:DUF3040 domain-containing protein n=1 Tax=Rhodococcus antarcticus TaxID=2987751 RepID=A0ABY6NVW4_9NOCA|nr:DUF3040 domain-containing protein [Rhodococcus antarcticus]UZJ23535.1 DUF3040 domain-containing protein [Rhodococcus antarcticus]
MPLSEHEQRLLDQIESALYADDPKFASNVRGARVRTATRKRRLQAVFLFVLGLVVLIAGVALGLPTIAVVAVSVVGFLMMFGSAVVLVTGRGAPGVAPSGPAPGASRGGDKQPGGFSSRMEERFKRRFDQP